MPTLIHKKQNKGAVMMVMTILFLVLSLIITFGVVNPTLRNIRMATDLLSSKQSLLLSDSGTSDAVYRLKNNLVLSGTEVLSLNGSYATTTITNTAAGKLVVGEGNYHDYRRNIEIEVNKGAGVSFFYGVQTGNGGFTLSGNSQVNGNIYSNGNITGGTVTGSAVAAGGLIDDVVVGEGGVGYAHAHTITDSTVAGELKCKTGSGNNKDCDTSFDDPEPVGMPITDEQINEWKNEAADGTTITGNYSPVGPVALGPTHITGDFTIRNTVTMTGTIWVEGVLSFSGTKAKVVMDSSTFGSNSGVIIVDKYTSFTGGSQIESTGQTGSYVMLLVTSDCPASGWCGGNKAISASGNAGSVVLAAPYGTINFSGNSSAKEVVAHKVTTGGSVTIDYEQGLSNLNFVSGPSGGYYIAGFREVE